MQPISFISNTGADTLDYTKLLLDSLKNNLDGKEHEVVIFIDKDNDGTYEYLKKVKNDFYDLKIVRHKLKGPVGYQRNSNLLVEIAKHDVVSYLQSDMVISKHYDTEVLKALTRNTILSSTRIEPSLHGISDKTITKDLGLNPQEFDLQEFLRFSESVKSNKVADYFFAPYTFHKETWIKIGGYDTLFRRAREDSDFVQRCLHAGIELKQTYSANVYHFTCVSSRGKNWYDSNNEKAKQRVELQKIADGIEMRRFLQKWGNFNHGETKLNKIDMDLVLKNSKSLNPMFIVQLEPFFSRVWLDDIDRREEILSTFKNQHEPANTLLGMSEEDWEHDRKYYNQTDYESIYRIGEPEKYNVKIEPDFGKINGNFQQDEFLKNLVNISTIVEPNESGVYELGCAQIHVINTVNLSLDRIKSNNPPFDMSMLVIE